MKVIPTSIPDVCLIEPRVFGDSRGYFLETYNKNVMRDIGVTQEFVQDNLSGSTKNVLRGIHYQIQRPQGKLVRVVAGEVFDVAVDLRKSSSTFGKWVGVRLSDENKRSLWLPAGFGHGFVVLSAMAIFAYKTTDFYSPIHERTILWNDPELGIEWPIDGTPVLSPKDLAGCPFRSAETYA